MTATNVQFLRHDGQHDQITHGGRFAAALNSKTGVFCVLHETAAFWFIEHNDDAEYLDGNDRPFKRAPLQVSKKTLKLAGRDAPRGGQFSIVEF